MNLGSEIKYIGIMNSNIIPFKDKQPVIASSAFIAPGAFVIGDVQIGEQSSVYYNAVIRGDINSIRIGDRTNIQDNVTVHLSHDQGVVLGNDITVGHNAVLHGCTVEDGCTIGMGAIIMDGALIRKNSIVGAGAVVPAGKEFPEESLILGVPAAFVRTLSAENIAKIHENTRHYVEQLSDLM